MKGIKKISDFRIGIFGAAGTGKSALADWLSTELRMPKIKEVVRSVADDLGITSIKMLEGQYDLRTRFQWCALLKQILEENRCKPMSISQIEPKGFISDRTTLDNALYWILAELPIICPEVLTTTYMKTCRDNMRNYDCLIFLRPEFPIEDDGFRDANISTQYKEDEIAEKLIFEWGLNLDNILVPTGTVKARGQQVMAWLTLKVTGIKYNTKES